MLGLAVLGSTSSLLVRVQYSTDVELSIDAEQLPPDFKARSPLTRLKKQDCRTLPCACKAQNPKAPATSRRLFGTRQAAAPNLPTCINTVSPHRDTIVICYPLGMKVGIFWAYRKHRTRKRVQKLEEKHHFGACACNVRGTIAPGQPWHPTNIGRVERIRNETHPAQRQ